MSWETIKLGDIADFSNGVNFDKSAYSKGVKLIGVSNFGNRFSPDYNSLEEIFCETFTLSANGSSTTFLPAMDISAVSLDPLVEIGSFTICTTIGWPGCKTSPILPSFSRILPILILE